MALFIRLALKCQLGLDMDMYGRSGQISLGYILPMLGLYMAEVMERHDFAKSRGLQVPNVASLLWSEAPAVLHEAFACVMTFVACSGWP